MNPRVFVLGLTLLPLVLLTGSCQRKGKANREAQRIPLEEIRIKRYEKALFTIDTSNMLEGLIRIQDDFLPFLGSDTIHFSDAMVINQFISDTMIRNIYDETISQFNDLKKLESDLTLAFKHIKYYFPFWDPPVVYSYVSGLLYEAPVKYNGSELIIALDMYLGNEFEMYRKIGMPLYKINRMNASYLLADCIEEIIRVDILQPEVPNTLLDKMIDEGRVYHLLGKFLPWVDDHYLIGFTSEQMRWCRKNEANMWAYFIENNLLYSADPIIINRFTNDGPFTAAFHNDSPARAAVWVGWQIFNTFADKNSHLSMVEMLGSYNAREVLLASGYKPGRSFL